MEAAQPRSDAIDLRAVSASLTRGANGVWYAAGCEPVSYDDCDHDACFQLEDESFWFAHRSNCLHSIVRRFPPAGAIYDLGGGNGFVTQTFLEAGFDAVLVEPGQAGVRNALVRGIPTILCATLATARFRTGGLPAAGLFDVLEHIDDDAGFLREVHRCLAASGRLYLTVPAFRWLWSDEDVKAGHFRRHTRSSMRARLQLTGFKLLYATYFFSLLPIPILFWRCLRSFFGHRPVRRAQAGTQHRARVRGVTDRIWAWELKRLSHGRTLPFGSSCLLVAEKV